MIKTKCGKIRNKNKKIKEYKINPKAVVRNYIPEAKRKLTELTEEIDRKQEKENFIFEFNFVRIFEKQMLIK